MNQGDRVVRSSTCTPWDHEDISNRSSTCTLNHGDIAIGVHVLDEVLHVQDEVIHVHVHGKMGTYCSNREQ